MSYLLPFGYTYLLLLASRPDGTRMFIYFQPGFDSNNPLPFGFTFELRITHRPAATHNFVSFGLLCLQRQHARFNHKKSAYNRYYADEFSCSITQINRIIIGVRR